VRLRIRRWIRKHPAEFLGGVVFVGYVSLLVLWSVMRQN